MSLVPFLLVLSLASPANPETVVRQFVAAEAAGDRAAAAALWTDPARAFTARQARRMETHCARLAGMTIAVTSDDDGNAIVETREMVATTGSLDGAVERAETAHSRFALTRTDAGWRITRRESLEELLVERLAHAGSAERMRLLSSSGGLRTETF